MHACTFHILVFLGIGNSVILLYMFCVLDKWRFVCKYVVVSMMFGCVVPKDL